MALTTDELWCWTRHSAWSIEGIEIPWEKSEYSQETIWRRFCEAHKKTRQKECKLSRFIQDALDGRTDTMVTQLEVYR
jgi:hypothetical protein